MKHFLLALFTAFLGLALSVPDAEAKRMGGGRNSGMQRDSGNFMKREAAPQTPAKPQPAATPQAPQKNAWLGPVAGLAAGLGLAALASHLGLGEEFASFLMLALLAVAAILLVRWLLRRSQAVQARPMQYAGAGNPNQAFEAPRAMPGSAPAPAATPPAATALPADFDVETFIRQAKVHFLRLQAAHDAGNLDDIREFTTPEMYAEIKLDIDARKGAPQRTEVSELDCEVVDAVEEGARYLVSVRFFGMIREDQEAPAAFDEIWHLTRPASGRGGWVVAGIQQNG